VGRRGLMLSHLNELRSQASRPSDALSRDRRAGGWPSVRQPGIGGPSRPSDPAPDVISGQCPARPVAHDYSRCSLLKRKRPDPYGYCCKAQKKVGGLRPDDADMLPGPSPGRKLAPGRSGFSSCQGRQRCPLRPLYRWSDGSRAVVSGLADVTGASSALRGRPTDDCPASVVEAVASSRDLGALRPRGRAIAAMVSHGRSHKERPGAIRPPIADFPGLCSPRDGRRPHVKGGGSAPPPAADSPPFEPPTAPRDSCPRHCPAPREDRPLRRRVHRPSGAIQLARRPKSERPTNWPLGRATPSG